MPTALLILALLTAQADDSEVNYCHDPGVNQQWGKLIEEAPSDDILMQLFALRLGLCQFVDGGMLDLDRATEIFEQARAGALTERRRQEEQERRPDQRTGT
jgi:hypothetical protein